MAFSKQKYIRSYPVDKKIKPRTDMSEDKDEIPTPRERKKEGFLDKWFRLIVIALLLIIIYMLFQCCNNNSGSMMGAQGTPSNPFMQGGQTPGPTMTPPSNPSQAQDKAEGEGLEVPEDEKSEKESEQPEKAKKKNPEPRKKLREDFVAPPTMEEEELFKQFKPHVLPSTSELQPQMKSIASSKVSFVDANGKKQNIKIKAFKASISEVSVLEYFYFANDTESNYPVFWTLGHQDDLRNKGNANNYFKGLCYENSCPVMGVNYHNIKAYIGWLNEQTGKQYSLLNEAQWHYLSQKSALSKEVWFKDNSEGKTHKAKTSKSSSQGIFDLYGNVAEWTIPSNAMQMKGSDVPVVLGGSWASAYKELKESKLTVQDHRNGFIGFRLVEN